MKLRTLAVLLLGLGIATPAAGETVRIARADYAALVEYRAAPDVAFTPGVDVRGRRVTPAGGPDRRAGENLVPAVLEFSIALNPLRGGAARFGETKLDVGLVRFDMESQRATLNGQRLSRDDTQKLSRKCQKILHQRK